MNLLFPALIALLFTFTWMPMARKFANWANWLDSPNQRKVHVDRVPLVGGLVLLAAVIPALWLVGALQELQREHLALLTGGVLMVLIGAVDDRVDIRASLKLLLQLALAHHAFQEGIRVDSLHGLFGIHELSMAWQYVLTMFMVTGCVNAFNFMDGIDGLAAGLALVGFGAFAVAAYWLGEDFVLALSIAIIGGLIGFLRYNLSAAQKVFLGDAGSLFLGFVLVTAGIGLVQKAGGGPHLSVILAMVLGILAFPVADCLRVSRRRIKRGLSPTHADRSHFHHLVLQLGMKHASSSLLIVLTSSMLFFVSVLLAPLLGLGLAILAVFLIFASFSTLLRLNQEMSKWKKRLSGMERQS